MIVYSVDGSTGSSPRGRGKPGGPLGGAGGRRLIPARAGKTKRVDELSQPLRAHPRAGGENATREYASACQLGSSPRGRGKPIATHVDMTTPRLIPARAGKTARPPRSGYCLPAHPRAGGENEGQGHCLIRRRGSSPRGRGKRSRRCRQASPRRLIPARAGKTQDTRTP